MRIFFTALFFLFLLSACWLLAHRMWRRNFLLCGPLAMGILIGLQSVLLNILSPFGAVSALSLLIGNIFFITSVIFAEIRRLGQKASYRNTATLLNARWICGPVGPTHWLCSLHRFCSCFFARPCCIRPTTSIVCAITWPASSTGSKMAPWPITPPR